MVASVLIMEMDLSFLRKQPIAPAEAVPVDKDNPISSHS